jgi:hypothetical protein
MLEVDVDDINVELWFHLDGPSAYIACESMDCVTAMFPRCVI